MDALGEVQCVGLAYRAIRPGLVLLHDDVAADRPVVLAIIGVVRVGAPEVRADHDEQPIRDFVAFGKVPEIVDRLSQFGQQRPRPIVVGRVRVESRHPEIRTYSDPRLEGENGKLHLQPQRTTPVILRHGGGELLEAFGHERGLVPATALTLARQQARGHGQPTSRDVAVVLERLPVRSVEVGCLRLTVGRRGDGANSVRVVKARRSRDARRIRETAETEVGCGQVPAVGCGEQGGHRRVALGRPTAPVVHNPRGVRVGLRIDAVDDQHPRIVLAEECDVVRERRVGDAASLPSSCLLRPVVDDRLARCVLLGIAEARRIPPTVGLHEDEHPAGVLLRLDQRQPEPAESAY